MMANINKKYIRLYICSFYLVFILISSRKEVAEIMIHSYHMGLTREPKYAFLAVDYRMYTKFPNQVWNDDLGTDYSHEFMNSVILEGLISVTAKYPNVTDTKYHEFAEDVVRRVQQDPFNHTATLKNKVSTCFFNVHVFITLLNVSWVYPQITSTLHTHL